MLDVAIAYNLKKYIKCISKKPIAVLKALRMSQNQDKTALVNSFSTYSMLLQKKSIVFEL